MRHNGFTLIELLVVVAIIGVLAAVGVVAFNGFINNAKINTVKANHSSVVDYIQSELWKCNLDQKQKHMKNNKLTHQYIVAMDRQNVTDNLEILLLVSCLIFITLMKKDTIILL